MAKHVKIVRTFPNSWYKFIVEGDATGLSDSERMIAESALSKAFPDGGDIIAARIGTKRQKYSTLVCESYSINGCPDKTEGKTFKVKVLADEKKNPKTYKQYVQEDIKTLVNRRTNSIDKAKEGVKAASRSSNDSFLASALGLSGEEGRALRKEMGLEGKEHAEEWKKYRESRLKSEIGRRKGGGESDVSRANDDLKKLNQTSDIDLVGNVAGYEPSRFDVTARVYDEWKQVFGTELNKDENAGKTEDGSDTITHEKAALLLQSEIIKAVESNDKDRLKELRPLLPLLAWYASKYKRQYTTLFNSMLTQGEQLKMSAYHKLIEVLPTVYDVAFNLDESEEAKQEAAKYVGNGKNLISRENFGDTPEKRKEYAVDVFDKVIYGTVLPEACAKTVTQSLASTQQTNFSRMERSEFNTYYKPFIDWYRENKDDFDMTGGIDTHWTKMEPYEFNYARGMYMLDSVRGMIMDIEEDVHSFPDDTKMTQNGITNAFVRKITFGDGNTNGGEKLDSRKKKCFDGLLKEMWSKLGLSVGTKKVAGRGKKDADEKMTQGTRTTTVLGDYPGDVKSFKEDFHKTCEAAKTKIESMLISLNNEFDQFKESYDEKMNEIVRGIESGDAKGLKQNRKPVPEFSLNKTKVLGEGAADREWVQQFTTSRMNELVFRTSLSQFRIRQLKRQGQHVIELGMDADQQNHVTGGGEELDASGAVLGGGDMASTEDQREQDEIGRGSDGDEGEADGGSIGHVSYDDDKDENEVNFAKLNEKLLESDEDEIKERAKDLNLNQERAVKIVGDWKKICEASGGIGEVMGIAKTKQGGKSNAANDADAQRYREEADKLIKAEEEKREADYEAAKTAYDDAKDGGDKDEIKSAKAEFETAKKNRKLSSKEKAEIVRKVRYADVGKGIDVQGSWDDLVDGKGALAQGVRKLGGSAVLALVRHFGYMIAPNGTDEDTYKGLPDMLVLLMHDEIMKCHEKNPEESLEACIYRVSLAARPEFITFTTDISQVHKYVSDRLSNESAGDDDKFLTSVEQMLDLIENSDLDAQAKLDMLDALELSFALWCEKNEVVPETINPEEDEDAVKNHPEDAE